jgi:hypothetical protein
MNNKDWETVYTDGSDSFKRMRMPFGWIVKYERDTSNGFCQMCYVPDMEHEWTIET